MSSENVVKIISDHSYSELFMFNRGGIIYWYIGISQYRAVNMIKVHVRKQKKDVLSSNIILYYISLSKTCLQQINQHH